MKKIFTVIFMVACCSTVTLAQQTGIDHADESWHLLDRLQTMNGAFPDRLFLSDAPVAAGYLHAFLRDMQGNGAATEMSNADNYDITKTLSSTGEYQYPDGTGALTSRYSLGPFYQKVTDFYYYNDHGLFVSVNPVLGFDGGRENEKAGNPLLNYTAGLSVRVKYRDWFALKLHPVYNHYEPASFISDWITLWGAVPGASSYRQHGTAFNYWLPTGVADVRLLKDYIHLSLGYDRNFIGDGYRSIFLSDFSGPAGFAKISTNIWKLQYENLYMILKKQDIPGMPVYDNSAVKYATAHHLSVNITRWLNVGAYEMVVFSRNNHFEFDYLNPVIFYRAVERSFGSPDKVAVGFNGKAIVNKHLNVYGQFMLNEFESKNFFSGKGSTRNKWGAQLGGNYFDAFGISNLDLQAEVNMIRPYTFQFRRDEGTATGNFSNANMPLAHPLGAGFRELVGIVRYRPSALWALDAKVMYYQQAVDTGDYNSGSNIFKNYNTIPADRTEGVGMVNGYGLSTRCLAANLNVSYQLKPDLYIDLGGVYRAFHYGQDYYPRQETVYGYAGLRLNLNRRNQIPF